MDIKLDQEPSITDLKFLVWHVTLAVSGYGGMACYNALKDTAAAVTRRYSQARSSTQIYELLDIQRSPFTTTYRPQMIYHRRFEKEIDPRASDSKSQKKTVLGPGGSGTGSGTDSTALAKKLRYVTSEHMQCSTVTESIGI